MKNSLKALVISFLLVLAVVPVSFLAIANGRPVARIAFVTEVPETLVTASAPAPVAIELPEVRIVVSSPARAARARVASFARAKPSATSIIEIRGAE